MSWQDRIKPARYTSPSGLAFEFQYEDVSKETDKKTTVFTFPDTDGVFIQDLGRAGRRFPFRLFFWGEDYDQTAKNFDVAIDEKGIGILDHPLYGTFDVVPFGTIKRIDNIKSAGNQAIFEITFFETNRLLFPESALELTDQVLLAIEDFSNLSPGLFDATVSVKTAAERESFKDSALSGLGKVQKSLQGVADTTEEIQREFNDIVDFIDTTIDVLIDDPIQLATQLVNLTRLPARAAASIGAKLEAYGNMISDLISGVSNQFSPGNDSQSENGFATNALLGGLGLVGLSESSIDETAEFTSSTDVLTATEDLINQTDSFVDWADENRERLAQDISPTRGPGTNDLIDTGETYQKLQQASAITAGRLIQISFTTNQARSIVLTEPRTILTFASEFYGQIDPVLDFIITSNNLTGAEILEIPKGREMVYYV